MKLIQRHYYSSLIAKIYDTKKKYSFGTSLDITHSISDIGIALSISETNVFNGAETLEASVRGTLVHLKI
jgi:hypothetical protein